MKKTCATCKRTSDEVEFEKTGVYCRECRRALRRKSYRKHRKSVIKMNTAWRRANLDQAKNTRRRWYFVHHARELRRQKEARQKVKLEVTNHYGGKCACCGEARLVFLTMDHIAGDGAEHRRKIKMKGNLHRWLKSNGYPSGFRVLCWNCNLAMAIDGACPHGNI